MRAHVGILRLETVEWLEIDGGKRKEFICKNI
jgi:hypothetical protein